MKSNIKKLLIKLHSCHSYEMGQRKRCGKIRTSGTVLQQIPLKKLLHVENSLKIKIEKLFVKIINTRFRNYKDIENWWHEQLNESAVTVVVRDCEGINDEIRNSTSNLDFSTDCCFKFLVSNLFKLQNRDFTLYYILDNDRQMYITDAFWS